MEKNWRKIIFLDIDSVVNSEQWYLKTRGRSGHFDPEAIALLNQLQDIGAEVVVSSSWGEDGVTQLRNVGLKLPILGHTERFDAEWFCRGNEIERWLLINFGGMGTKYGLDSTGQPYHRTRFPNGNPDYEYVIFDDDCDFLLGQKDNFIRVDAKTGITQADIDKARKILTRQ